jgi:RHS repeat-associated protein
MANTLLGDAAFSYQPDAEGLGRMTKRTNRATSGAESFGYQADGKLLHYENASLSSDAKFDALGRRVSKTFQLGGQTFTQSFSYLGDSLQILMGKAGNGDVYLYPSGQGEDEHFGQISTAGVQSYVTDHQYSVLNTSTAGPSRLFSPFGENMGSAPTPNVSREPAAFSWQGLQAELDSGDIGNRDRNYSPYRGGFTSADRLGFDSGETNLFISRKNNPLIFGDPTGLVCEYSQSTGKYSCWYGPVGPQAPYVQGKGYAGNGAGFNNPSMQNVPNVGPLPQGRYSIGAPILQTNGGLKNALPLTPLPGTNTFGRNSFLIHGENSNKPPLSSSNGCPVIGPNDRSKIPGGETLYVGP